MKIILVAFKLMAVLVLLALTGCASTSQVQQTEQMLTQAGFKTIAASSDKQVQHLQTLPVDKLTMVKLKDKTIYVFPDPAHNQIYVGSLTEYQSYQQILGDSKIAAQSRVMDELGEDGNNHANWAEWSNNTGWTYGN